MKWQRAESILRRMRTHAERASPYSGHFSNPRNGAPSSPTIHVTCGGVAHRLHLFVAQPRLGCIDLQLLRPRLTRGGHIDREQVRICCVTSPTLLDTNRRPSRLLVMLAPLATIMIECDLRCLDRGITRPGRLVNSDTSARMLVLALRSPSTSRLRHSQTGSSTNLFEGCRRVLRAG